MGEVTFTVRGADGAGLAGDPVKVAHSTKVVLVVEVKGRNPGVTYKGTLTHGAQNPMSNADVPETGMMFPIESVTKAEHGGAWTANVVGSDGNALASKTLNLEVTEAPATPTEPPGVYDKKFGQAVGITIAVATLIFVVVMAAVLVDRQQSEVPVVWVLAFGLFFVGVLLAAVGAYFAALEVRGKLISAEEKEVLAKRGVEVKDVATLVEAVGKLRGTAAVIVLAVACLISAAWIGYGSTRPDSPATTTTTTTTN